MSLSPGIHRPFQTAQMRKSRCQKKLEGVVALWRGSPISGWWKTFLRKVRWQQAKHYGELETKVAD